jgi:flagellar motor protein MotB
MSYLQRNGVEGKRLEFEGFGESEPVATNETAEGRAKNRRTEFVVLEK